MTVCPFQSTQSPQIGDEAYEYRVKDKGLLVFSPPTASAEKEPARRVPSMEFVLPDRVILRQLTKR